MDLRIDVSGACSRIDYGKKGDKVEILKDHDWTSKVVENNGEKFIVANEHLSYDKIQKDSPVTEVVKKSADRIQPLRARKRSR